MPHLAPLVKPSQIAAIGIARAPTGSNFLPLGSCNDTNIPPARDFVRCMKPQRCRHQATARRGRGNRERRRTIICDHVDPAREAPLLGYYYPMRRKSSGFTLIELLVVISIIALLSSVVVSALSTSRKKARDSQRVQAMQEIRKALELYATDNNGKYPVTGGWAGADCGYSACNSKAALLTSIFVPKYLPVWPRDPTPNPGTGDWGYQLYSDENSYLLVTFSSVEIACEPKSLVGGYDSRTYVMCSTPNSYYCPGHSTYVPKC
jgi:prepilin-type N-terminal cleavage/methylation domain-containing protein